MAWCLHPWDKESPPSTGTGMPCCRHHALPHAPGKPMGRRKGGSGHVGGSGIALVGIEGPVPSHSTPPHCLSCLRGRAGCAGDPHLLWECEMHRSVWGHCPARSEHHLPHGGQHPEMLHIPPTPPTPIPASQGSPGCFPCTPNLPRSGLASACAVSFGSSQNLTPAERKACPTAGCLSTC